MFGKETMLNLSLSLIVLIFIWPVYFFVFSGLELIQMNIFELAYFSFIEIIFIVILIIFWKIYSKKNKK